MGLSVERKKRDRQTKVAKLRLSGVGDQWEIARQLGVNQSTISRDFADLDKQFMLQAGKDVAVAKAVDLARVDAMLAALWDKCLKGNMPAIDRAVKLLDRRAKLLGLDAPLKVNLDVLIQQAAEQYGLDPAEVAELHTSVAGYLAQPKEAGG